MSIQTSEQAELERLRAENAALRKGAWHKHDRELREQYQDGAVRAYFRANVLKDTTHNRQLFSEAFRDGWGAAWQAAIDAAMREQAMQALVDQAQELDMGYGERE